MLPENANAPRRKGRSDHGVDGTSTKQSLAPTTFSLQRPSCQACPTAAHSWEWVSILTSLALNGDAPARDQLPLAVAHALDIEAAA